MDNFEEDPLNNVCRKSKEFKSKYPGQYLLAFLVAIGLMINVILKLSTNIAIIEMTSHKTVTLNNKTITYQPDFQWDSKTKGLITSSVFYGYLTTPITGYITGKWGGVKSLGVGGVILSVLSILSPLFLKLNLYWFIGIRFLQGIGLAFCYTSVSNIWSQWSAPEDRSKFMSFSFTGVNTGIVLIFPLCGFIGHEFGWPAIFYSTGATGLIFYILWFILTSDKSSTKNLCTRKPLENTYYPWKKLFTSRPIFVLCVTKFTYGWGYSLISSCLPLYVKDILNVNTTHVGFLSAIPNTISIFIIPLTGCFLDLITSKKWLTATQTHKLFDFFGFLIAAIGVFMINFTVDFNIIMVYLTLFKIFLSITFVVKEVLPLYITPKYASDVSGLSAVWYTVANIATPTFVGFIVTHRTLTQWGVVYVSTGGILLVGGLIFLLFSSSKPLPWAMVE